MGIFDFKNYFKNNKKTTEIKSKSILSDKEKFDVEAYNEWFCNEYDGYDSRKGAKGIFLRIDKLSSSMITDWFDHLNCEYDFDDRMEMMKLIRLNWRKKLAND